jgi:hypothetical protein
MNIREAKIIAKRNGYRIVKESTGRYHYDYEEDHAGIILQKMVDDLVVKDKFLQGDDTSIFLEEIDNIESKFDEDEAMARIDDYISNYF